MAEVVDSIIVELRTRKPGEIAAAKRSDGMPRERDKENGDG